MLAVTETLVVLLLAVLEGVRGVADAAPVALSQSSRPGGTGGGCVYSFQVWRPGQDVLHRLRNVELQCTNSSLSWERHVADLRSQVNSHVNPPINTLASNLQNFVFSVLEKTWMQS